MSYRAEPDPKLLEAIADVLRQWDKNKEQPIEIASKVMDCIFEFNWDSKNR